MAEHISCGDYAALRSDPSNEAYTRALTFVRMQFDVPYYRSRGDAIRGVAAFARTPERRTEIVAVLRAGIDAALWRG